MGYSRQASEDTLDIWLHIATSDPKNADRVLDRIKERCEQLNEFPRLGPSRPDIAAEARALVIERWLAIYRISADGVEVVRIVDGTQDLPSLVLPSD